MIRFLHAADLHIDSPLLGLDRYDGAPVDKLRSATRRALENLVELALDTPVDFVLLAGDIYDRDWKDFHTGLFFREQIVRLHRQGIPVFIIHGNHDAQGEIAHSLRLPDNVRTFSSRSAETFTLDELKVAIHGRSFPKRAVSEDLVPDYPEARPDHFNIGLLHTSLSGYAGHDNYAPTSLDTLINKGYDYWALGHVHTREVLHSRPRIVFPGNTQGRHARETGAKGCELVSWDGNHLQSQFVPLDQVRWHRLALDLSGLELIGEMVERFHQTLHQAIEGAGDRLHAVRVELRGSSPLQRQEARQPGKLAAELRAATQDFLAAEIWLERVKVTMTAPIDRQALAGQPDAIGALVRLVDEISANPGELQTFIEQALRDLLTKLPAEIHDDPPLDLADPSQLANLLRDAEATVLARLNGGDA